MLRRSLLKWLALIPFLPINTAKLQRPGNLQITEMFCTHCGRSIHQELLASRGRWLVFARVGHMQLCDHCFRNISVCIRRKNGTTYGADVARDSHIVIFGFHEDAEYGVVQIHGARKMSLGK